MTFIEVKSQDQFTDIVSNQASDRLLTLYFYTTWAEPCKQMSEIVEALSKEPSNKDIYFLSINAEECLEISDVFEVGSVPYFIFIRKGDILKEFSGADPQQLMDVLNSFKENNIDSITKRHSNVELEEEEEEETEEQLTERLKNLTKAAPVMLFMKGIPSDPKCGFSRQMVGILREHQVRFGFFDILKDDSVRQGLKIFSDWPTFPQLYINGEFQGGLDIIKESLEEDSEFFQHALGT